MAADARNELADGSLKLAEINIWFHGIIDANVPRHKTSIHLYYGLRRSEDTFREENQERAATLTEAAARITHGQCT
jgi:hypothetical protein